ncbi:MAG: hypothetical protein E7598_04700 [Ruminococcaceae bacterium]|nr:hypothetical protein [Oscillospiraceae bacterium]
MSFALAGVAALLFIFGIVFGISHDNMAAVAKADSMQREIRASVYPNQAEKEDINGFSINILCDMSASAGFCDAENAAQSLSLLAEKRNDHFEAETGAVLSVTPSADFYKAATNDILSDTKEYNLFAADVSSSLSHLLSAGNLHDISDSKYIDTSEKWFDGVVMDNLSVYGGKYLISSAAADARRNACVIVYNRDLAPSSMKPPVMLASNGEFTVEKMLEYSRAVYSSGENGEAAFYGASFGEEDVFPLIFGVGGVFVRTSADATSVEPLSSLRVKLEKVASIVNDSSVSYGTKDFSESHSLFSVKTISEIPHLRKTVGNIGILPLPKFDENSKYSGYIDLDGAVMMAIPAGVLEHEKVEYALDRFARLSYEYIVPYFESEVIGENDDDARILEIIAEGVSSDLSSLFGYGDIASLFADVVSGKEQNFKLEYYNRKTLYEKAISIIEKRLAAN